MTLNTDEWMMLKDGRRYMGECDETTHLPQGLGIIAIDKDHFYAGEFKQGKRHGRGFIIYHEVYSRKENVWVRGSYEEVMATAEFDSCGRVIHTDRVGHYVQDTVSYWSWNKLQDGIWDDDNFISPVDLSPLKQDPWKWAETIYTQTDFYGNKPGNNPYTYNNNISSAKADGSYSFNGDAFVTVYDDSHLMFCDSYGHVFILGENEEYHYDVMWSNGTIKARHNFMLRINEPDYKMVFEKNQFNELIAYTFSASNELSPKARPYFLRIFYFRNNIFRLSKESIKIIKKAAGYGNIYAQFAYGRYHIVVKPSPKSIEQSLQLFTAAHEKGLADATASLAEAWRYGDYQMVNHEKAGQMLANAMEMKSEYAVVLRLKELIYGTAIKEGNAEEALKMAKSQLYDNPNECKYDGAWLYYMALAYINLGNEKDGENYLGHATNYGFLDAWVDLAIRKGHPDENGEITNSVAYIDTLREGAKRGNLESRLFLAWKEIEEFNNLPSDQQTEQVAQELISELEECYRHGSRMAAECLGDIYYNGFCLQSKDMEKAWEWYEKAAKWDLPSAYEKLYDMVYYHDKDLDLHEHDMLELKGARLGSRHLLDQTVIIHTQGRLEEFAEEIEKYYDPIFDDESDDTPDDDGRFDAWA